MLEIESNVLVCVRIVFFRSRNAKIVSFRHTIILWYCVSLAANLSVLPRTRLLATVPYLRLKIWILLADRAHGRQLRICDCKTTRKKASVLSIHAERLDFDARWTFQLLLPVEKIATASNETNLMNPLHQMRKPSGLVHEWPTRRRKVEILTHLLHFTLSQVDPFSFSCVRAPTIHLCLSCLWKFSLSKFPCRCSMQRLHSTSALNREWTWPCGIILEVEELHHQNMQTTRAKNDVINSGFKLQQLPKKIPVQINTMQRQLWTN